jgi:hypothetical protein
MRIAKPILLVSTPLGIVTGLIQAYRMVGGLVIVMFAMRSAQMARARSRSESASPSRCSCF